MFKFLMTAAMILASTSAFADMQSKKPENRPTHALCVFDEASMIDMTSLHNAMKYLPEATAIFS